MRHRHCQPLSQRTPAALSAFPAVLRPPVSPPTPHAGVAPDPLLSPPPAHRSRGCRPRCSCRWRRGWSGWRGCTSCSTASAPTTPPRPVPPAMSPRPSALCAPHPPLPPPTLAASKGGACGARPCRLPGPLWVDLACAGTVGVDALYGSAWEGWAPRAPAPSPLPFEFHMLLSPRACPPTPTPNRSLSPRRLTPGSALKTTSRRSPSRPPNLPPP